jgi:hypothetical protein
MILALASSPARSVLTPINMPAAVKVSVPPGPSASSKSVVEPANVSVSRNPSAVAAVTPFGRKRSMTSPPGAPLKSQMFLKLAPPPAS